tara:strand:- start:157 stop:945 length:789 start_codon:yes stop_codon:yes gene_type:complete
LSKKRNTLEEVFVRCVESENLVFDSDYAKEISIKHNFSNHHDLTHIERKELLPKAMIDKDYFVIRLGKGKYKFIKGISSYYHPFEPINNVKDWSYKKNILDELNTSESNILSVISNQGIIQDFLYGDRREIPNVYNAHRTSHTFKYKLKNNEIECDSMQIEVDLTLESRGRITVFEAKNKFSEDFAKYQIYFPFRKYYDEYLEGKIKITNKRDLFEVDSCYVQREEVQGVSVIRMYLYTFVDPGDICSIKLKKSCEYRLIPN